MQDYITSCEEAARLGGQVLRDWAGRFHVTEKGPADLVTEADIASEKAIRELLDSHYPGDGFLGEEGSTPGDPPVLSESPRCWIVDPLDGTTNFVHGLNGYCVSVACCEQGQIVAGAVYDPLADACFTASLGAGARLDGELLHVSATSDMSEALVVGSLPPRVQRDSLPVDQFLDVMEACQAMRRLGSAALNLCYLAAGRVDAYWAGSVSVWDIAAGVLIVEEAGGHVTSSTGEPLDLERPHLAAAATVKLHGQLTELLARR